MNYDDLNDLQKLAFDYGYQSEMEKLAGPQWGNLGKAVYRNFRGYKNNLTGHNLKRAQNILNTRALKGGMVPRDAATVKKIDDAAARVAKVKRNTNIARVGTGLVGGTALTGGGAYAYNKRNNNKR